MRLAVGRGKEGDGVGVFEDVNNIFGSNLMFNSMIQN